MALDLETREQLIDTVRRFVTERNAIRNQRHWHPAGT